MMTPEQVKIVVQAYNHLLENEKRGWDGLDEFILLLEFMTNDELCREVDVLHEYHSYGNVKCDIEHVKEKCFVPLLVEAVDAILELYKETGELHPKNQYILHYYLAMCNCNMIIVEG